MIQFDIGRDYLKETWASNSMSTTPTTTLTTTPTTNATTGATDATATTVVSTASSVLPTEHQLLNLFNHSLPLDIRIQKIHPVTSQFNVMKPKWKRYHYTYPSDFEMLAQYIRTRNKEENTTTTALVPTLPPSLAAMQQAATYLVGTHDFGSYQSSNGRYSTK